MYIQVIAAAFLFFWGLVAIIGIESNGGIVQSVVAGFWQTVLGCVMGVTAAGAIWLTINGAALSSAF